MKKIFQLRGFQVLLIVLISALFGYFVGTNRVAFTWKNYIPIVSVSSKTPPAGQNLDMKLFYEVLDRVGQDYYDKSKIDSKKLLEGAINGMLSSLDDPYTSFFPPKENTEFKTQLAGEFTGIGAELSMSPDNQIVVVSPLDDSPAQKAGIKAGDLILEVDNEDTNGWTVGQAVEKIRGPKGSSVVLNVLHENSKSPTDIKITRDVIVVKSVTGWVKNFTCDGTSCKESSTGEPITYIRLSQFGDKTNDEWTQVINNLNASMQKNNAKGVILDLRNNPGGYLNDAVFIASEFLNNGVVVIQENAAKQQDSLSVTRRGTLTDYPVIVLINKGSASASEIVAGALRDHKRATLLGENSFGKGTVQQAIDVDGGGSIHISVAKWLTPNGTWVNKKGLAPDIKVTYDASKSAKLSNGLDNQLQEAIKQLLK